MILQFEHDTILIPRETAWFGYYGEEQNSVVQTPQEVGMLLSTPPFFSVPGKTSPSFLKENFIGWFRVSYFLFLLCHHPFKTTPLNFILILLN